MALNIKGRVVGLDESIQDIVNRVNRRGLSVKIRASDYTQPLGRITQKADEFSKSLEASNARVIAFGASAAIIGSVATAFSQVVIQAVKVEKLLTDINVVLGTSLSNLEKFGKDLFDVARNTSQGLEVAAEAALEFSRQGLSMEETLRRTNDALILTRLTGIDAAAAVSGLTAAVNGFADAGLTTTAIINKLAAVDVKFAVSADDLINALARSGAVAQDAGVSFDQLVGAVTSAQQITARGGAVIGNSFKTIFTRIQRSSTLDRLEELGVAVRDIRGNTLPALSVLTELAKTYETLGASTKAAVAEQVGGVFQINVLKAALKDLSRESSLYAQATSISANATDQAQQKNAQLQQTLSSLAKQTSLTVQELAANIGELSLAPGISNILDAINSAGEALNDLFGSDSESLGSDFAKGLVRGIGNVLTGPGMVIAFGIFGKLFFNALKFAKSSLKDILGIVSAKDKEKKIQESIVMALGNNKQLALELNKYAGDKVQQEKIMLGVIADQTKFLERQAQLAASLAPGLLRAGVTPGLTQGKPKTASSGLVPKESSVSNVEAAAEIGGAQKAGYQPGKIKKTKVKGVGDVVYNDAETVKKFDGFSQEAIMPPQQSKAGKQYKSKFENQHGFDPYKFDGLIPNFIDPRTRSQKVNDVLSDPANKGIKFKNNKAGQNVNFQLNNSNERKFIETFLKQKIGDGGLYLDRLRKVNGYSEDQINRLRNLRTKYQAGSSVSLNGTPVYYEGLIPNFANQASIIPGTNILKLPQAKMQVETSVADYKGNKKTGLHTLEAPVSTVAGHIKSQQKELLALQQSGINVLSRDVFFSSYDNPKNRKERKASAVGEAEDFAKTKKGRRTPTSKAVGDKYDKAINKKHTGALGYKMTHDQAKVDQIGKGLAPLESKYNKIEQANLMAKSIRLYSDRSISDFLRRRGLTQEGQSFQRENFSDSLNVLSQSGIDTESLSLKEQAKLVKQYNLYKGLIPNFAKVNYQNVRSSLYNASTIDDFLENTNLDKVQASHLFGEHSKESDAFVRHLAFDSIKNDSKYKIAPKLDTPTKFFNQIKKQKTKPKEKQLITPFEEDLDRIALKAGRSEHKKLKEKYKPLTTAYNYKNAYSKLKKKEYDSIEQYAKDVNIPKSYLSDSQLFSPDAGLHAGLKYHLNENEIKDFRNRINKLNDRGPGQAKQLIKGNAFEKYIVEEAFNKSYSKDSKPFDLENINAQSSDPNLRKLFDIQGPYTYGDTIWSQNDYGHGPAKVLKKIMNQKSLFNFSRFKQPKSKALPVAMKGKSASDSVKTYQFNYGTKVADMIGMPDQRRGKTTARHTVTENKNRLTSDSREGPSTKIKPRLGEQIPDGSKIAFTYARDYVNVGDQAASILEQIKDGEAEPNIRKKLKELNAFGGLIPNFARIKWSIDKAKNQYALQGSGSDLDAFAYYLSNVSAEHPNMVKPAAVSEFRKRTKQLSNQMSKETDKAKQNNPMGFGRQGAKHHTALRGVRNNPFRTIDTKGLFIKDLGKHVKQFNKFGVFGDQNIDKYDSFFQNKGLIPNFANLTLYRGQKRDTIDKPTIGKNMPSFGGVKTPEDAVKVIQNFVKSHVSGPMSGYRDVGEVDNVMPSGATSFSTSKTVAKNFAGSITIGQPVTEGQVLSKTVPEKNVFNKKKLLRILSKGADPKKGYYPKVEEFKKAMASGAIQKWAEQNGGIYLNVSGRRNDPSLLKHYKTEYGRKDHDFYGKSMNQMVPGEDNGLNPNGTFQISPREQEVTQVFNRGLIPNFVSALSQSIEREKVAGIAGSMIRVDQDDSLKSRLNPIGLAVTNTRDEPAGVKQGIQRAKEMGIDPKTHGASSGLIPNFIGQRKGNMGDFDSSANSSFSNFTKTVNNSSKALEDQTQTVEKNINSTDENGQTTSDLTGRLFGLTTITYLLEGAFSEMEGTTGEVLKGVTSFAQGISQGALVFEALSPMTKEFAEKMIETGNELSKAPESIGGMLKGKLASSVGKVAKALPMLGAAVSFAAPVFTALRENTTLFDSSMDTLRKSSEKTAKSLSSLSSAMEATKGVIETRDSLNKLANSSEAQTYQGRMKQIELQTQLFTRQTELSKSAAGLSQVIDMSAKEFQSMTSGTKKGMEELQVAMLKASQVSFFQSQRKEMKEAVNMESWYTDNQFEARDYFEGGLDNRELRSTQSFKQDMSREDQRKFDIAAVNLTRGVANPNASKEMNLKTFDRVDKTINKTRETVREGQGDITLANFNSSFQEREDAILDSMLDLSKTLEKSNPALSAWLETQVKNGTSSGEIQMMLQAIQENYSIIGDESDKLSKESKVELARTKELNAMRSSILNSMTLQNQIAENQLTLLKEDRGYAMQAMQHRAKLTESLSFLSDNTQAQENQSIQEQQIQNKYLSKKEQANQKALQAQDQFIKSQFVDKNGDQSKNNFSDLRKEARVSLNEPAGPSGSTAMRMKEKFHPAGSDEAFDANLKSLRQNADRKGLSYTNEQGDQVKFSDSIADIKSPEEANLATAKYLQGIKDSAQKHEQILKLQEMGITSNENLNSRMQSINDQKSEELNLAEQQKKKATENLAQLKKEFLFNLGGKNAAEQKLQRYKELVKELEGEGGIRKNMQDKLSDDLSAITIMGEISKETNDVKRKFLNSLSGQQQLIEAMTVTMENELTTELEILAKARARLKAEDAQTPEGEKLRDLTKQTIEGKVSNESTGFTKKIRDRKTESSAKFKSDEFGKNFFENAADFNLVDLQEAGRELAEQFRADKEAGVHTQKTLNDISQEGRNFSQSLRDMQDRLKKGDYGDKARQSSLSGLVSSAGDLQASQDKSKELTFNEKSSIDSKTLGGRSPFDVFGAGSTAFDVDAEKALTGLDTEMNNATNRFRAFSERGVFTQQAITEMGKESLSFKETLIKLKKRLEDGDYGTKALEQIDTDNISAEGESQAISRKREVITDPDSPFKGLTGFAAEAKVRIKNLNNSTDNLVEQFDANKEAGFYQAEASHNYVKTQTEGKEAQERFTEALKKGQFQLEALEGMKEAARNFEQEMIRATTELESGEGFKEGRRDVQRKEIGVQRDLQRAVGSRDAYQEKQDAGEGDFGVKIAESELAVAKARKEMNIELGKEALFRDTISQRIAENNVALERFGETLANTAFDSVENGFVDMFKNISDGTKSLSDSFKSFAGGIAKSIGDALQQRAAKQLTSGIFDLLGMGDSSTPKTENKVSGGMIRGYANGGSVGNSRQVPTMLTSGEYVVRKKIVDKLGAQSFEKINSSGSLDEVYNQSNEDLFDIATEGSSMLPQNNLESSGSVLQNHLLKSTPQKDFTQSESTGSNAAENDNYSFAESMNQSTKLLSSSVSSLSKYVQGGLVKGGVQFLKEGGWVKDAYNWGKDKLSSKGSDSALMNISKGAGTMAGSYYASKDNDKDDKEDDAPKPPPKPQALNTSSALNIDPTSNMMSARYKAQDSYRADYGQYLLDKYEYEVQKKNQKTEERASQWNSLATGLASSFLSNDLTKELGRMKDGMKLGMGSKEYSMYEDSLKDSKDWVASGKPEGRPESERKSDYLTPKMGALNNPNSSPKDLSGSGGIQKASPIASSNQNNTTKNFNFTSSSPKLNSNPKSPDAELMDQMMAGLKLDLKNEGGSVTGTTNSPTQTSIFNSSDVNNRNSSNSFSSTLNNFQSKNNPINRGFSTQSQFNGSSFNNHSSSYNARNNSNAINSQSYDSKFSSSNRNSINNDQYSYFYTGGQVKSNKNENLMRNIPGMSAGGKVFGPSGIDKVGPIMLDKGEYVVKSSSVQKMEKKYPGFFDKINSMKMNQGGMVGSKTNPSSKVVNNDNSNSSSSSDNVNITINISSDGSASNQGDGNVDQQNLAKQIQEAVVGVIGQEKRVGGSLRGK